MEKTKVTIFFVTHNIREAVLLSEKIVVFATRPGKIKEIHYFTTMKDGIMPNDVNVSFGETDFGITARRN